MTIMFATDGTAKCVYSEVIPLGSIGVLDIQRQSLVEFDAHRQVWAVMDRQGEEVFSSPSRQVCLEWEADELDVG